MFIKRLEIYILVRMYMQLSVRIMKSVLLVVCVGCRRVWSGVFGRGRLWSGVVGCSAPPSPRSDARARLVTCMYLSELFILALVCAVYVCLLSAVVARHVGRRSQNDDFVQIVVNARIKEKIFAI